MIQELFHDLSEALTASAGLALGAAFCWGVLSVVLSPCHLASIPLVVGFVSGQQELTQRRAVLLASVFAAGILVTIAVLGLITYAAGHVVGRLGPWGAYIMAGIFFLVGLNLLDVIPLPWSGPGNVAVRQRGLLGALLLGLLFGVALGPCTFSYMIPVLGLTMKIAASRPIFAILLMLLYGLGHCSVIVAAGSLGGAVQRYLNWNQRSGAVQWLRRACGVLVILAGLYLLYTA